MNLNPSVAPCPVPPIIVIAESCVAITESPTAHHGSERLARKYPSMSVLRDLRSPSQTTYPSHPTTMIQLIGCMEVLALVREGRLQPPEERERDELHRHHSHERAAKPRARFLGCGRRRGCGQTFALRLVDCVSVRTSFTMRACSCVCAA